MPPAAVMALWMDSDLYASFEIAFRDASLAFVFCSMIESSGAMPPASTIEPRFSAESDARLARAAHALSCAEEPFSASMSTSCLMIRARLADSIERRTSTSLA